MYNGIGLQTARGSGTNGYVQTNKFFVRPKSSKLVDSSKGFGPDQGTAGIARKPNRDILEHDRKRQIELKLTILEDKLSDQGYTESEIVDKLNEARASLEAADAASYGDGVNPIFANEKNVSDTQTHQIAARKEKQLETMRAALGISLPEDKEEKRHGLVDFDAHEDNDEKKPRNHKKGGSEGDGEYEEGEILHRNEDGEAKLQRREENLVSERKFEAKGRKSDRSIKDEDDYRHKKGQIRKHTDKKSRRAHSSTDTESDSMHSTDPGRDSALGTKGKQRAQRKKSKKSETSGSDSSASESDDSGDVPRKRRGQERHVQKHKKNEQRKTQGRKKEVSESSDSDLRSEKARETDSDTETRRKHRYDKSKMIKSISRDYSDHSSDGLEEKHKKGRQVKLVKSHKRRDSDESDLENKKRHASEKSKTLKSQVNSDSDHTSDDSDREPERWGSKKFEEGHKRQASERDCNAEIKTKYRDGKSERSKPAIIDASDYSSDDSRRKRQRREAHKTHKSDKDNDTHIKQKSRSEKPSTVKPKVNSDSDSDSYQKEREYQRKSGQFEKAHRSRDVDNVRALSPEVQDVNRHVKRGRHDSEDDDSDGKLKSQRSEVIRARYDDKERKDDRKGQNRDDEYKRKPVEAADNRDYMRQRKDTSKSDDREVSGGRNEDVDYRKKQDRSMHGHERRRDTSRSDDREVSGGRQEDVDYRKKQDRSVHELAHRRHRQDGREHADRVPGDDQSRGQRRDEKEFERKREYENDYKRQRREDGDGNQRRGRREEDDDGRRQEMERESSKRTRYEDSSTGDRRHHDRVDFSEDRWR